jgi:chaperone modulatory protein CbpM
VSSRKTLGGEILDERAVISLHEVCRICNAREETIVELIREGIVDPRPDPQAKWVFSGASITRIQTALRLQQDLHVNLPGAALAIELLDEIRRLRARSSR